MGVVRYAVECPGCSDKIVLRLGIGYDKRQPFFYVCGRCRAATRGALTVHEGAKTTLELERISKTPQQNECAGEFEEAEEVLGFVLVPDHQAARAH